MIEQLSNSLKFVAFFTESKLGKTGLTVTCDIYKNGSSLSTGNACTEIGGGLYSYTLASGSVDAEGDYIAIFKTSTTSVDQQHLPSLWVVNKAGVENLDAAVSSRNATTPPTASSVATAVRTELGTELGRIDVAVSSRNATTPPTAASVATAVRTELNTELGRVDAAVSTRAAPGDAMTLNAAQRVKLDASQPDYAPAKAGDAMTLTTVYRDAFIALIVAAIETELANDATGEAFLEAIRVKLESAWDIEDLSISAIANATGEYMLNAVLAGNYDIAGSVGKKLQALPDSGTVNTVTPDNAGIAEIKAKTDNLPASPAATGDVPSAASVASAVRTELTTELARVDVAVSTRNATAPDNASITAIKERTDALPASPAATSDIPSAASIAAAVWAYATRTLSSFGTLIADVWSNNQRTLTAFDFAIETTAPTVEEIAAAIQDAGDPWATTDLASYPEDSAGRLFSRLAIGDGSSPVTVIPEAPPDQSLCRVYGYFENVGNSPAAGTVFVFTLIAPGLPTSERGIIGRRVEATTNAEGYLQVDLQRNDLLSPAGSKYKVECKSLNLGNAEMTLAAESFDLITLFAA